MNSMTRHMALIPSFCLLSVIGAVHAADLQRREKPNIIVILADDLGYADLGCQGSREAVTPHWPMEAKPEHMATFAHVRDPHRRTMLAMTASLDENVGRVLAKLREVGLEESTLVFFLSDNGGPTGKPRANPDAPFEYGQNTSRNDPCRGVKGELLEGGIRVPFLVQWKGRIPAGKTYDDPVISLDILPTASAAASAVVHIPEGELELLE